MDFSSARSHSVFASQKGFTLIELIIALAIFSIGLVGAYMMLERSQFLSAASQDEIIAYNLMRGDIEEIKNMRDTNWVALRDWDAIDPSDSTKKLAPNSDYLVSEVVDSSSATSTLKLTSRTTTDDKLCRKDDTPEYGYCNTLGFTTATKFRKYLRVEQIKDDIDGSGQMDSTLRITSFVSSESPKRVYSLSALITDWKK